MVSDEYEFELGDLVIKNSFRDYYSKCNRAIGAWIIFILVHDFGYVGQYRFLLIIHIKANQYIKIHTHAYIYI